jgi:Flp pilus assembly protein TadG
MPVIESRNKAGGLAMLQQITAVIAGLGRLVRRCEGSVAIIFALCAIPLIICAGMAIDIGRAYAVKVRLGAALDAAALAVGSEVNQTPTQLTADMQNYFTANYPSTALGTDVTITPVPANADLTAATVNFQAQATVPMTLMRLVGINSITVTATAQTQKTTGLEIAVVLDNTGSMLCGPNDGAPNYSDSTCSPGVVASDTACASSTSRICTLINAATEFVDTLTGAITASQQLYIGIVPYVTTVNVGNALCSGAATCSNITSDSCSGDFTDDKGNIIDIAATSITTTVTGNTTRNSTSITTVSNISSVSPYMAITGSGISTNTYVSAVNTGTNTITISANATANGTRTTLTLGPGGATTNGSPTVTIGSPAAITAGMVVTGTGIPANTAVKTVTGATITLCNNATATGHPALTLYNPVTYDTTDTATTQNWMGCVVEPTSSDENSGVSGVLNASVTDPDYTEPASWPSWYPFWWASGSGNSWTTAATIKAQTSATEVQGKVVTDWGGFPGPNQGCPVPLLPLTDVTTSTGKTQVLNTISSMWPRDAGGTQVHIGMIWGWRVLSPNGPFASNGGHPLSYSDAANTGWKKAVVLMTDGTEEWPTTTHLTGLGVIADGKIGTTGNTSTAVTNLNTRLTDVCSNMKASGDFIIYTIGLGTDGASNTALQNCATTSNGGFFEAATPTNLQTVFNDIAKSLIALRLTQ